MTVFMQSIGIIYGCTSCDFYRQAIPQHQPGAYILRHQCVSARMGGECTREYLSGHRAIAESCVSHQFGPLVLSPLSEIYGRKRVCATVPCLSPYPPTTHRGRCSMLPTSSSSSGNLHVHWHQILQPSLYFGFWVVSEVLRA